MSYCQGVPKLSNSLYINCYIRLIDLISVIDKMIVYTYIDDVCAVDDIKVR